MKTSNRGSTGVNRGNGEIDLCSLRSLLFNSGLVAGKPELREYKAVSVVGDQETVDRAMEAGASAYHVKPIRRNELIATVRSQLAKRGQPKH